MQRFRAMNPGEDPMPRTQTIEFALSPRPDRESHAGGEVITSDVRSTNAGSPRSRRELSSLSCVPKPLNRYF